jgi:hypothetical protein
MTYLTNWTLGLLIVYYFCAASCSIYGINNPALFTKAQDARDAHNAHGNEEDNTSRFREKLLLPAQALRLMFEVAGSASLFVALVAGLLLHNGNTLQDGAFANVIKHNVTALTMLIELGTHECI